MSRCFLPLKAVGSGKFLIVAWLKSNRYRAMTTVIICARLLSMISSEAKLSPPPSEMPTSDVKISFVDAS